MADISEVKPGLSTTLETTNKRSSRKEKGKGKGYRDEQHPYMTPEFWLDENNHFWNRSSIFKKESYMAVVERAKKEVKTDLIIHSI